MYRAKTWQLRKNQMRVPLYETGYTNRYFFCIMPLSVIRKRFIKVLKIILEDVIYGQHKRVSDAV